MELGVAPSVLLGEDVVMLATLSDVLTARAEAIERAQKGRR